MPSNTEPLTEELLLAILYRVGAEVRLADDRRLARLLNQVAEKQGGPFRSLAWDPHYFFCRALTSALQTFDLGGVISRENAATKYFFVSSHTAGSFGRQYYDALEATVQDVIDSLAKDIQSTFGDDLEHQRTSGAVRS